MQGMVNLIIALVLLVIFFLVIIGLGKLSDKFQTNYIKENMQGKFRDKALFVIVFITLCFVFFVANNVS